MLDGYQTQVIAAMNEGRVVHYNPHCVGDDWNAAEEISDRAWEAQQQEERETFGYTMGYPRGDADFTKVLEEKFGWDLMIRYTVDEFNSEASFAYHEYDDADPDCDGEDDCVCGALVCDTCYEVID